MLWSIDDIPLVPSGETVVFLANYPAPDSPQEAVAVEGWDAAQSGDYRANSAADGSGTDRSSSLAVATQDFATFRQLTVTNNHTGDLYITRLRVRGRPLSVSESAELVVTDQDSIDDYELKSYPVNARWLSSIAAARGYGQWILTLRKDPQQKVTVTANMNDDLTAALEVELSDKVALTTGAGKADMFIENVQHVISKGGRHDMTVILTPAAVIGNVFILDESLLDEGILA